MRFLLAVCAAAALFLCSSCGSIPLDSGDIRGELAPIADAFAAAAPDLAPVVGSVVELAVQFEGLTAELETIKSGVESIPAELEAIDERSQDEGGVPLWAQLATGALAVLSTVATSAKLGKDGALKAREREHAVAAAARNPGAG